jgi:hypothetical protein
MAKWKELSDIGIPISTPSPEAIVRAALELAALEANAWFYDPEADMVTDTRLANAIRSLADSRDEINAILLKASGEEQG